MAPILNLRHLLISGTIVTIDPVRPDKAGKEKFTFSLNVKAPNKKSQNLAFITSYEIKIKDMPWFRQDKFIFLECYWVRDSFFILQGASPDAYECYRDFIERIYTFNGEDVG
jgi:hypothetical protein